jgi:hypothetical protein
VDTVFTCDDAGGLASCDGPAKLNTSTLGTHTFTVTAEDLVGNKTSLSRTYDVATELLVIDDDSIDNGTAPNFFQVRAVNDQIARIGLRTPLPAFDGANVGRTYTLHTGSVGDEGWFALKTIPATWNAAGPTADGKRNYFGNPAQPFPHSVGAGLGRAPNPERFLDKIPDVAPLRATALAMLAERNAPICAVVYDGDIGMNYGPINGSLKGANLGTVAFQVLSSTPQTGSSASSLPAVTVRVLNPRNVCGKLLLFEEAPVPTSPSQPFDTGR